MSGLQLATKNDEAPSAGPMAPPPPIPTVDEGSQTQESYNLPTPGAAPTGAPPPPPPPPSQMPAVAHHGAVMEESGTSGGKRLGVTLGILALVGGIGTGGWYLYQHPELMNFFRKTPMTAPAKWPAIELTGMAGAVGTDEAGSAILNGNLVAVNQGIDGVVLVELSVEGVVLEFEHERKLLRIGESTN